MAKVRTLGQENPHSLTAGFRAHLYQGGAGLEGSFSLDKLVFTFDVPKESWERFRRRMRRFGDPNRGGHIYREALMIPDPAGSGENILIQWAPYSLSKVPFARVELNPAKTHGWPKVLREEVQPFLRRGWRSTHITRVDPAVDYPVALQDHVYYAGNHKGTIHYTREGIETVYLGSVKSENRLRIYDKAKELAIRGEPVPTHPLTRVEAQRRSTNLSAAELDALPNPFRRLGVAQPTPEGLPFRYELYFQEAEKTGADSVLKRLGKRERKRFKEELARMPPIIQHPARVFDENYSPFCHERLTLFFE